MRITTTLASFASLGLIAGCAAEDQPAPLPSVSELAEGINVISADPAQGVLGAYRAGDDVVYFETRVGFLKPEIYQKAYADEPAEEMDLRFVDRNGLPFYVQRGGDEFVDPTWNDSIAEAFKAVVPDDARARDFVLAKAAGLAFPEIAEPALDAHSFHLRAIGERPVPAEDPALHAPTDMAEATPRPEESYAVASESGWWYLAGGMSHSSVGVFGTHGSVAYWAYDTSWKFRMNFCNHGSCTGSHQCYTYANDWVYNPWIWYEGSTSTGTVSGGCSTSYYWDGGSGYHNSNDDTAYELWQIKEGTPYTSRGNNYSFSWDASNKHYQCDGNNGRWTAPANCP